MTDIHGNPVIRDVSSHGVPGVVGAPEGSILYGPKQRAVEVTEERFPDLDPTYVRERDQLTDQKQRASRARAAREVR
jgi:hypothetical protein